MANVFAPFGFSQRQGTGSSPTYEQTKMLIDGNQTAIYFGDPVARITDGTIGGNASTPANGTTLPGNATLAGIFIGCEYNSVAQKRKVWSNYWPGSDVIAGGNATGYVVNDPFAQFLVQAGNSTTVGVTLGNVGQNVQFLYGNQSNASANGISQAALDMGVGFATTATLPFRIVTIVTDPPTAPGTQAGQYNYVVVAFNNVETKNNTGV